MKRRTAKTMDDTFAPLQGNPSSRHRRRRQEQVTLACWSSAYVSVRGSNSMEDVLSISLCLLGLGGGKHDRASENSPQPCNPPTGRKGREGGTRVDAALRGRPATRESVYGFGSHVARAEQAGGGGRHVSTMQRVAAAHVRKCVWRSVTRGKRWTRWWR
ncbi:hypothetical protein BHE74_00026999 [Ensete ventricosum]|nr:hypothetical protein BHE74_00026999 [Ensete ventricosum]